MSTGPTRLLHDPAAVAARRPPTDEQAAAIARTGGWTLLSAAAGSGKTTVLTERIVRAVTGPDAVPLAEVLAITFTEKAAGELRERVRSALAASDEPRRAREVEQATISTIHAFCARLLRRHALAAGLDPAFTVLDAADASALRSRAWDAALAAWLDAGGEGALDLVAAYRVDEVRTAIAAVHDDLRSQGIDPPVLPALAPADVDALLGALRGAAEAASTENAECGLSDNDTSQRAMEHVGDCRAALAAWAPGAAPPDLADIRTFKGAARLKLPGYLAFVDALEACRRRMEDRRAAEDYGRLGDLLTRYAEAYADAKRAAGGLDFDDLELHAAAVLAQPGIAERERRRHRRVLVDEFQDTNPVQLALVEALGAEDVFLVGDEFQSIYGFRHADVRVIREVRERVAPEGGALPLAGNFRSDPGIVTAVNAAFAGPFGAAYTPMHARREAAPEAAGPVVELLVTDAPAWMGKKKTGEGEDPLPEVPSLGASLGAEPLWRQAEARLLAQRLADLRAGEPELRLGDIAILVRAHASMPVFEQALADVGIPSITSGGRGYWSQQQVGDLIAWLRLLANPRDEPALWHVLASPLVGASTDALSLLMLAGREQAGKAPGVVERMADADGGPAALDGLPADEVERLRAFAAFLRVERAELGRRPLAALIARVVAATGYDEQVLVLPGGERRLANVRKLGRLAAAHEERHGRDLRGFLDAVAAEQDEAGREPDAPIGLTDDGAVQIMTIHAAKGLEFPVVCVVDCGRKLPSESVLLTARGARAGVRAKWLGEQGHHKAFDYPELAAEAKQAREAEYHRLFYVALTRAERRLIVSGADATGPHVFSWLAPALAPGALDDLRPAVPPAARRTVTVRDAAGTETQVQVAYNAPATVGEVLREASLAPTGPAGEGDWPAAGPPAPVSVPPPAPEAGLPVATVSYSSLGGYDRCAYRWYLERVLRLPQEADGALRTASAGLDPLTRGSLVHRALETLDFAAPDAAAHVAAAVAEADAAPTGEETAGMVALVDAFAGSALCARLAAAREVRREAGFAFVLGDGDEPVLNGFIDALAREDDGALLVVDYKTDRVGDRDLEALVERDYGAQRALYALAALRAGAAEVEVAHVFLERPHEPAAARFGAADRPGLEARVRARLAGIAAGRFPVAAVPHRGLCAGCPGRTTLCSHEEALTERTWEEAHTVPAGSDPDPGEPAGTLF